MNQLKLSDVQISNLTLLLTIRDGLLQDRLATSCKFALTAALADQLRTLSPDDLWSTVSHVGQNTLFPPRQDLLALLQAPKPLAGTLAAVNAPWPSPPFSKS